MRPRRKFRPSLTESSYKSIWGEEIWINQFSLMKKSKAMVSSRNALLKAKVTSETGEREGRRDGRKLTVPSSFDSYLKMILS